MKTYALVFVLLFSAVGCVSTGHYSDDLVDTELALSYDETIDIDVVSLEIIDADGNHTVVEFVIDGAPYIYNTRVRPGVTDFYGQALKDGVVIAEGEAIGVEIMPGIVNSVPLTLTVIGGGDSTVETPIVIEINDEPEILIVTAPFRVTTDETFTVRVLAEGADVDGLTVLIGIDGVSETIITDNLDCFGYSGELTAPRFPGNFRVIVEVTDTSGITVVTSKPLFVEPSLELNSMLDGIREMVGVDYETGRLIPPVDIIVFELPPEIQSALESQISLLNSWIDDGMLVAYPPVDEPYVHVEVVDGSALDHPDLSVELLGLELIALKSQLGLLSSAIEDPATMVDPVGAVWPELAGLGLDLHFDALLDPSVPQTSGLTGSLELLEALPNAELMPVALVRLGILPAITVPFGATPIDIDWDGVPDGYVRVQSDGVFWWVDMDGDEAMGAGEFGTVKGADRFDIDQGLDSDGEVKTFIEFFEGPYHVHREGPWVAPDNR